MEDELEGKLANLIADGFKAEIMPSALIPVIEKCFGEQITNKAILIAETLMLNGLRIS